MDTIVGESQGLNADQAEAKPPV